MAIDSTQWTKKQKLTIRATSSDTGNAEIIDGAHSNFVWSLTEANIDDGFFSIFKTDGGDIRFTTDAQGQNELAFDIILFDKANKNLYIKVKLPIVAPDNLQSFYIWGGNSNANLYGNSDTYGRYAVWSDYTLVYLPTDDVLNGDVTDRTGNYTISQSGCSSSNFTSTPRGTAFTTSSGSQYLKITDFKFSQFSTKDFSIFAVVKSAETGWIGVFGDESSYNQSGTNTFFFQKSSNELWWEFGGTNFNPSGIDAAYIDISNWSGFSAIRIDKTVRVLMGLGQNAFGFKGDFDNTADRPVVIGMADPSYPIKGEIEEFSITLDKPVTEQFHNTYVHQLLNADFSIDKGTYEDAPYTISADIIVKVVDVNTKGGIENANVMILKKSDKTKIVSGTTNSSGVYSTSIDYSADIEFVGWARQADLSGTDYEQSDFSGTITSNGINVEITLTPVSV